MVDFQIYTTALTMTDISCTVEEGVIAGSKQNKEKKNKPKNPHSDI